MTAQVAAALARLRNFTATRAGAALASLGAGLAAAMAHPPFGFTPGLLGFAALLQLLDRVDGRRPLRSAFWRGWLAGLAYFFVSTSWVGEAFQVDAAAHGWQGPFAVGLLAAGLALLFGGAALAYRWSAPAGPRRLLAFAAWFSVEEWLRGHLLTGFPWDLVGEAWRAGSPMSQGAALVGAYGLTLATLILAAAPGLALDPRLPPRRRGEILAGAALALALVWSGGALRLALARPNLTPIAVRVVQADIDQKDKWKPENLAAILGAYGQLTAQPTPRRPDLVIWPEGAIPASMNDYLAPQTWTRLLVEQALTPGQVLLVGGYREVDGAAGPRFFNSLAALRRTPDGLVVIGLYDKHRLVPFGEYFPMDSLADALGLKKLVHVGDGFTAGPRPAPLAAPGLPALQPLICYESLFPSLPAPSSSRPSLIVNISNDAWFGATSGPLQHLNIASYRAIETGLPMVRATPTGVSAVIDPFGRPLKTLGHGQKADLDMVLPGPEAAPPYARFGDSLFFILAALVMIVSLPIRFYDAATHMVKAMASRGHSRRS